MTYRVLEVSEWYVLKPIFDEHNSPMPDPRFGMIIGAFDETNTIAGFICTQLMLHAEPMVLYKSAALRGLIHTMEKEIITRMGGPVQYFAFVNGITEELSKHFGLEEVPYKAYRKQLS